VLLLRTLFEATEAAGGERLADLAALVYLLGVALVLWRALSAVVTGVLEALTSRAGLQLGWPGARSAAPRSASRCPRGSGRG
jgi:hypothetical protein